MYFVKEVTFSNSFQQW